MFIAFWLTSLILSGAAVYLSAELRQQQSLELQGLAPVKLVERSTFIARRLPQDIDEWQQQLAENDIQLYVAYEDRSPLSSPNYSDDIEKMLEALKTSAYQEESSLTRLRVGRREISLNGEQIRFVIDMPGTMFLKSKNGLAKLVCNLFWQ